VLLFTLPLLSQQSQHLPGRSWSPTIVRPEPPRDLDSRAFRLQAIHKDAEDLSTLSAELQSDLQQLQKGVLSKDLADNLKRMEKLSKKLRQEVTP
jgi:hypothetical protein